MKAKRLDLGLYDYRGFIIYKTDHYTWIAKTKYGEFFCEEKKKAIAKEKIDERIKLQNELFNKKRYEQRQ